ncbi:MAG TPA: RNB domain-containing ribonuclease [Bryobacteraceae bacterium]|nr:RNB domain-containing ribonuclease [Bryobacteraceae bacterium]
MNHTHGNHYDLTALARQEMIDEGFVPDFPPDAERQAAALRSHPAQAPADGAVRDLRALLWSSIDNDTSRDLDQIEVAERLDHGAIRIRVGIADVDGDVAKGSPIDAHAAANCTTVYTGVKNFSMLPDDLSTDLTSLNEHADRLSVVVEVTVAADGSVQDGTAYRAVTRNAAQLAYSSVGPWLEGHGEPPEKVAASPDLRDQLRLQDEAAQKLREMRHRLGALDLDRAETEAVVSDGHVTGIRPRHRNRASQLIEDFMIAANGVIARLLHDKSVPSIRRVVKTPERWDRIVELAARAGGRLPADPDSGALNRFLIARRAADPLHYADLSLAVVKLMGPGEYVLERPGGEQIGHFALAVHDYTHSTAPNRRFADLVTQRLVKAVLASQGTPYGDAELDSVARRCTEREDAARKVERAMSKRIAAVAMRDRIGEVFPAVVTGVVPKGTFVRLVSPPVEGRLMRGEHGLDVGDQVRVRLLNTDPGRGFIDFGRA